MRRTLETILDGRDLDEAEASDALHALAAGAAPASVAGALLAALRVKGETAAEVRGFARAMRALARRPSIAAGPPLVDAVGTGGDGSGSLNLSTGAALLAAACGLRVVKHGNRSVSSRSGSADVIEALGVRMPMDESAAGACLDATGFTFLFAPYYHPAMAALSPVRRELGVRTIFNLLGPLTNPAEPAYVLAGAYSPCAARLLADTLAGLPVARAFVVHGEAGWDEPTPAGPFVLHDVRPGRVESRTVDPGLYGLPRCRHEDLAGGDAALNAARLREALGGEPGAHRDALGLGAALVLALAGEARSPRAAAAEAAAAIDDGRASALLDRLPEASRAA